MADNRARAAARRAKEEAEVQEAAAETAAATAAAKAQAEDTVRKLQQHHMEQVKMLRCLLQGVWVIDNRGRWGGQRGLVVG